MQAQDIIRAIEDRAAPDFGLWMIGTAGNPDTAKQTYKNEGEDTQDWLQWPADSDEIARTVKNHFLDEGMKGSERADTGNPTFVYIF